ncbi:hypothetical protein G7046_g7329 [Stylonectria norvegica]|nr:hypothetical protein G7046_g7329 [Stylonectria norvegica]
MASAQAMEEELQQSVMLSDEDAEYETADTAGEASTINAVGSDLPEAGNGVSGNDDDLELTDQDASGEELDIELEELDEDAEGEENNDFLLDRQIAINGHQTHEQQEMDEEGDIDAEGEEEDQEEGVGAVKIKPGESEDEEEDAESEVSDLPSAPEDESDEEAPWEDAADDADEDEEDSEAAPSNNCVFCKQAEENDPSEDFEAYLACTRCGGNAHQQCARDAAAMSEHNDLNEWKCPECFHEYSEAEDQEERNGDDAAVEEHTRSKSPQSDVPTTTHDLLPDEPENTGSDSQPATNDLGVADEPTDGTRLLRKRRTSSVEPEDSGVSLRKRRRNRSTEPASSLEDAADTANSIEAKRQLSSRTLRLKVSRPQSVKVEKRTRNSLVLKITVRPGNLKEILSRRKRDRKRVPGSATRPTREPSLPTTPAPARPAATPRRNPTPNPIPLPIASLPTPFTSDSYSQPFYSFFDRETDDAKGKPYGGILTEAERRIHPKPYLQRRIVEDTDVPMRKPKKSTDNASQIECIEFGGWEIDTWYAAPYPAEYSRNRVLYICEFCLKYMNSDYVAWRHKLKCPAKHPPGDEIYRHGSVSVFEVDGRKNPVYCQNLCLLAKLFLGSKTLYYDVEPFLFYVLAEYDDCGYHFVGYFSKEKRASSQNNVSCILTLPIHQRKGYGNLLIDFSYLLTKVEEKTGSPEKPLSDMGLVSYRNYWRLILCRYFLNLMDEGTYKNEGRTYKSGGLSIKRISDDTGMTADDVIAALEGLRALVRDPQTKLYAFRVDVDYCRQYVAKWEAKGYVKLKPAALAWTPYVMGRNNANFELGPAINAIAPREDDEAKIQEGPNTVGAESQPILNGEKGTAPDQGLELVVEPTELKPKPGQEPVTSIEKVSHEYKENVSPKDEDMQDNVADGAEAWALPYRDVPPSRFEVFPTITGSRRADRSRQSVTRPSAPRTTSNTVRPKPKRSGGSSRRPTAPRPKSASKRKSGGTGRGPGRWPKGTKKADYGNADSGPGLPPGWRSKQQQARSRSSVDGKAENKVEVAASQSLEEDSVFVAPILTNGVAHEENDEDRDASGAETDREHEGDNGEDVDADGEDV